MRQTVWSITGYLIAATLSLYLIDYYVVDFKAAISAVTMLPLFLVDWVLALDIDKLVCDLKYPVIILIVGLLFLRIVMKAKLRIKPPEKEE